MSQRFKRFVEEIGEATAFSPKKNMLLNFLKDYAKNRRKTEYDKVVFVLRMRWPKYKQGSKISHLLKKLNEAVFTRWLTNVFIYRKSPLKLKNAAAVSSVDFIQDYEYIFRTSEMQIIEEYLEERALGVNEETVAKRIWLYCIFAFAQPVEEIFERPFAFTLTWVEGERLENGNFHVKARISAREQ